MIPLDKTIITREMIDAAADSLANEPPLFGESVSRFEEEFARFCGTDFAVSVASGTDALIFSLMAGGLKGKRALTTPSSYVATANSAFHAGGEPVFCDIDPETNNISPEKIEMALAKKTNKKSAISALVPVHLHGYPADMGRIMELAERKKLFVVEDACQAHGAFWAGRRVGSIGHAGAFSFNPVKNMTVGGEAGMITTNDQKLAKDVRMLADAGRESIYTHEHAIVGFSSRLNSVNAAIGRVQLRLLDGWNEKRRWAASEYRRQLKQISGSAIRLPAEESAEIVPAYNKFAIRTITEKERDSLKDFLYLRGIESDSHYPIPIHLQPPYKKMGYEKGDFPIAERFADTTLSLPMYIDITAEEITVVCDAVKEFFEKK
ncbi:MAG: DegT/DnrJ/EryC1/StrS family aminotransferase [Candidatus Micrarchaeota archaeon]